MPVRQPQDERVGWLTRFAGHSGAGFFVMMLSESMTVHGVVIFKSVMPNAFQMPACVVYSDYYLVIQYLAECTTRHV